MNDQKVRKFKNGDRVLRDFDQRIYLVEDAIDLQNGNFTGAYLLRNLEDSWSLCGVLELHLKLVKTNRNSQTS